MKSKILLSSAVAVLFAAPAFCSSLQDWEFNVNGTDYYPLGGATLGTVPGLDASAFNSTTGLGTLTLTFNPGAAGNYFLGGWFFNPVAVPFYNEYGMVNGSAGAGQSWQIDVPEYDATSANLGPGTIIDNLANGTLDDTNHVPGTTTNYLSNCGANGGGAVNANCNDLVSMAQGFNFALDADQEEVVTFTLSSTNPGGFSLEDVHPVDGANATEADVFYAASAEAVCVGANCGGPPPPTVPEPASLGLLATAGGTLVFALKRRVSRF